MLTIELKHLFFFQSLDYTKNSVKKKKKPLYILSFLILLGLVLRFLGIYFGLPYTNVHPDEPMLRNVISKILDGLFNTKWYIYPNFYMYLVSFSIFLLMSFKLANLPFLYLKSLELSRKRLLIFKVGRPISALFGIFQIPLSYNIAKMLFDEKIALITALIVTVNPSLILHSHYLTTDSTLFFFMLLTLYLSLRYYKQPKFINLTAVCLSCGIATGTKYTGLISIAIIYILLFILFLEKKLSFGKLVIFSLFVIGETILFFILTNPFIVKDFNIFKKHFFTVFGVHGIVLDQKVFQRLFKICFSQGENIIQILGLPCFLFSILGLILIAKKALQTHRYELITIILFPLFYFFTVITTNNIDERYITPLVPYLAMASSLFILELTQNLRKFKQPAVIFLILTAIIFPLYKSIDLDRQLLGEETKIEATKWTKDNVPPPLRYYFETLTILAPDRNGKYARRLGALPPKLFIKRNVDFIVLNNTYKKYFKNKFNRFYSWVEKNCFLIKKFQSTTFQYINPTIEIYGINNNYKATNYENIIQAKISYEGGKNYQYQLRIDRKPIKLLKPTSSVRTITREVSLKKTMYHSIIIHSLKYSKKYNQNENIKISISLTPKSKNISIKKNSFNGIVKPNQPFIAVFQLEDVFLNYKTKPRNK